jgi:hypothetical protein
VTDSLDITCRTATALIPDYLDDDLRDDQATRLEQHLLVCPGCLAMVQRARAGVVALAALRTDRRRDAVWARVVAAEVGDGGGVVAYKFLRGGRKSPFLGVRWPAPEDGWLAAARSASGRGAGHPVHACRVTDLAFWIDESLWRVELDGNVTEHRTGLTADRARLIQPVPGWLDVADRFAADCMARLDAIARTSELRSYANDAREALADADSAAVRASDVGYILAHAVDIAGWDGDGHTEPQAQQVRGSYELERLRQSTWLADQLHLTAHPTD